MEKRPDLLRPACFGIRRSSAHSQPILPRPTSCPAAHPSRAAVQVTGGEAMYDQRLFNQDTGVGAGLGAEDAYNLYDKPLFADRAELFKHTVREGGRLEVG